MKAYTRIATLAVCMAGCAQHTQPSVSKFLNWNDYSTAYCTDVAYRLPELADQLQKNATATKNWGAVVTGGIAVAGSILTSALLADEDAEGNAENRTAAIVSASVTGAGSLAALIVTALSGQGPEQDIKQANDKANSIGAAVREYRQNCNAAEKEQRGCYVAAVRLARECDTMRYSANLRLDKYPPPDSMPVDQFPLNPEVDAAAPRDSEAVPAVPPATSPNLPVSPQRQPAPSSELPLQPTTPPTPPNE